MENNDEKNRKLDSITEEEIYETLAKRNMFSGIELNDTEKKQLTKLIAGEAFKLVEFLNKDNNVYDYYLSNDGEKQFNRWERISLGAFVNFRTIPDEWYDSMRHLEKRDRINFDSIFKLHEFEKISLYAIYDRYYIHNMIECENEELSEEKSMLAIFGLANFLISKGIDFKDETIADVFKSELADSIGDFNDSYSDVKHIINNKLIELHNLLYDTIIEINEINNIKKYGEPRTYAAWSCYSKFTCKYIDDESFNKTFFKDRLLGRIKAFNYIFTKSNNSKKNITAFSKAVCEGNDPELLDQIGEDVLIPEWIFEDKSKEDESKKHLKSLYNLLVNSYKKFQEITGIDSETFTGIIDNIELDMFDENKAPKSINDRNQLQKALYIEMQGIERIIGINKDCLFPSYRSRNHYSNPCDRVKDAIVTNNSFLRNHLYSSNVIPEVKHYQKIVRDAEESSTDNALKDFIRAERRYQQAASILLVRKNILNAIQNLCYVPTDKETDYGKNFQTINKETSAIGDLEIE